VNTLTPLLTDAVVLGNSARPPADYNALVILAVFIVIALLLAGLAVVLSRIGPR
jgi:hypothetical protein